MRELSIFCDESGDFGPYSAHSPYYLIGLVFHDQSESLADQAAKLQNGLIECGLPSSHAIHTAPLIRKELAYAAMEGQVRRKVFNKLVAFMRCSSIRIKTFLIKKKEFGSGDNLADRLAYEIGLFLRDNLAFFQSYDHIVVYYDKGQKEITKVLRVIFSATLNEVEFRFVHPEDYHLFQVADLACTMKLVECKRSQSCMSNSEKTFFGGSRAFARNYLKEFRKKEF